MSYSSFINNPELQLQSYSLVNANPAVVPLTVNAANQLDIFLCRDAGGANEITMALPAGIYSLSFSASLNIVASATAPTGLQNLQVILTNTAGTVLASSVYTQTSETAGASTVVLTDNAVVRLPVATALKLRANYLNTEAGFTPTFGIGALCRVDAIQIFPASI